MAACFALAAGAAWAEPTVNLWPGTAPGSEGWSQKEQVVPNTPIGTVVLDVVTPTLELFLPEKSKATGVGVIVAPGGFCVALALSAEGTDVARRLQDHGIAAFVLKYRLQEKQGEGIPKDLDMDKACRYGIADGIQAVKFVRQHAEEWGVAPGKLGFMGFSAGGMVASGVLLQPDAEARPDFAALLYGAPFGVMPAIPPKLPPLFMAWAQDDGLAGPTVAGFYQKLVEAGDKPEAHIYSHGGHGFALKQQGTTSDHWLEEFYFWLQAQGFIPSKN
ncbi:MAG TPA: alpha/beta hydrolase [Gammaproteobacteria bacterium]|nr:alpha/beta hydrolase [Gammaproteobacteria bacterium]